jgi:plastocyanin
MRLTSLTLVALLAAACSGGGTGPDGNGSQGTIPPLDVTVRATPAIAFNPTPVDVRVGGTVTFAFEGTAHSVKFHPAAGAPADIPGNNANVSVPRTFAQEGTYDYECTIHPGMAGRIVVRNSASSSTGTGGTGGTGGYP